MTIKRGKYKFRTRLLKPCLSSRISSLIQGKFQILIPCMTRNPRVNIILKTKICILTLMLRK